MARAVTSQPIINFWSGPRGWSTVKELIGSRPTLGDLHRATPWVWVYCEACPHYSPLACAVAVIRLGADASSDMLRQCARCTQAECVVRTLDEQPRAISELGDQLLRQACIDARAWPSDLTLAFNISGIQWRDPTIGLRILAILAETGFNPRRLELEITETALVDNIKVAQNVTGQLRQAGVRIALDDFGTGYATLSQLLSLKLDRIKIDRSFVNRLGKDKESTTIVRAVLGLANGFELETTAEGVENDEQLASLRAEGCLEGQGYLFSKAVPANEVQGLLGNLRSDAKAVG